MNSLKYTSVIKKILLGFCLSLFCLSASAQSKKFEKGIERYNFQAYTEAIDLFKKAYDEDKTSITALRYIASSYRQLKDYQNAELYYTLVVNSDSVTSEDYLYFGQSLRSNGKLIAAKDQFMKFANQEDNKFLGNLMLQSFDEIFVWELEGSKYSTDTIGNINSSLADYGLISYKDKYYLTSNRDESHTSPEEFGWDGTPFLGIYELDTAYFNSQSKSFSLSGGSVNSAYNDGPMAISVSTGKAVITRVDNQLGGKDFINRMKIYEGEYINNKWKNFKSLPFNNDDYSVGYACYLDSGKSIIFASDKPGGYGGMDLYISQKTNDKWSESKNLGASINTAMDEIFPYVKGDRLFFSSNGHIGYGGFDLLSSEKIDGTFLKPKNLKSPVNSIRDDFGIFYQTDSTGFFTSNREGGLGDDDIYRFYESHKIQTVGISGVFEYMGLPISGAKVLLLDGNDSIIAVSFTDSTGNFRFSKLAYQENFLMQIETDDEEIAETGKIYLTNQNGDKIKLIERLRDGNFQFTALPAEEYGPIELLEEEDIDSLPRELLFVGTVYEKLPGDYQNEIKVYLIDDNGNLIDSALTDAYGKFEFNKLALDDNRKYFVKIDESDELNIAFSNDYGRIFKVTENKDGRGYKLISELDPSESPTISTKKGITAVIARLEYNGEPLANTKVEIYDENNKLIATLFTNENGEFQYNKLSIDGTYFFKLPEADSDVLENSFLYVTSINGDPLYLINKLKDGTFKFNALPFDDYAGIQLLEESAVPDFIDFKGVVYKKLPGDYNEPLKVCILNDKEEIIDSVYTDNYGRFDFTKLNSEKNYSFRLANEDQLNIALMNSSNQIIELTILDEEGSFKYDKLTYMVTIFDLIDAVDPFDVKVIKDNTVSVYGQIFRKLPGDMTEGTQVSIYDDQGNFVGIAKTDTEGNFYYHRLKPENTYVFKIKNEDGSYQILTKDEYGRVISTVIKNKNGEFEYKSLPLDTNTVSQISAFDGGIKFSSSQNKNLDLDTLFVYYRFDSTTVNSKSKKTLATYINKIKGKDVIIEVNSYTDNRGSNNYNLKLSKKRTENLIKILTKNGIKTEKIRSSYFGESNPVVNCEAKKCDNNDHAKNRRSSLTVKIIN